MLQSHLYLNKKVKILKPSCPKQITTWNIEQNSLEIETKPWTVRLMKLFIVLAAAERCLPYISNSENTLPVSQSEIMIKKKHWAWCPHYAWYSVWISQISGPVPKGVGTALRTVDRNNWRILLDNEIMRNNECAETLHLLLMALS